MVGPRARSRTLADVRRLVHGATACPRRPGAARCGRAAGRPSPRVGDSGHRRARRGGGPARGGGGRGIPGRLGGADQRGAARGAPAAPFLLATGPVDLEVEVRDDGRGIAADGVAGVGLRSLRERWRSSGAGTRWSARTRVGRRSGRGCRCADERRTRGNRCRRSRGGWRCRWRPAGPGAHRRRPPDLRDGLAALLEPLPGIEVVGAAADGAEAVVLAAEHRPDVIVMDIQMPH